MPQNSACKKCPLRKDAKTVCLWGEPQSKKPDIMVIGEAPGREEDAAGRPFIGRSGEGLRNVLTQLDLLDRCYITNACKCRPKDNRTPFMTELRKCKVYLDEEIAALKPKFIVLLGASAIKSFTGKTSIKVAEYRKMHQWKHGTATVLATYHPAAALRTESRWADIIDDLYRIKTNDFRAPERIKWSKVKRLTIPKIVAFDIETSGLNPFKEGAKILSVAYSSKVGEAKATTDIAAFVRALRKSDSSTLVGHNIKFDLLWLRIHHGYIHKGEVVDTMVMAHLIDENAPRKSLKYLATQHTGMGFYAEEIQPDKLSEASEEKLLQYNSEDAAATWMLFKRLSPKIKEEKLEQALSMDCRAILTLVDAEAKGFCVSPPLVKNQIRQRNRATGVIKRRFEEKFGEHLLDSPKKLGSLLYEHLDLPILRTTPSGAPSTNQEAIEELYDYCGGEQLPWLQDILTYRHNSKLVRTYLGKMEGWADRNDRIHPSFHVCGTKTGRFSCSEPNLQNFPRESTGPKEVVTSGPGSILVRADYGQIELRLGAFLSSDERMLKLLKEGHDLHRETAKEIIGKDPTDEERGYAKTINFGILYGMGPASLSRRTGLHINDARAFIREWKKLYPGIVSWQKEVAKSVLDVGYVASIFGRRRRLPLYITSREEELKAIRQACNFPIQSAAADLCKMAMIILNNLPCAQVIGNIHDEILLEVQEGTEKSTIDQVIYTMSQATQLVRKFGYRTKFTLPTPVEVKVGTIWAHTKELEDWYAEKQR